LSGKALVLKAPVREGAFVRRGTYPGGVCPDTWEITPVPVKNPCTTAGISDYTPLLTKQSDFSSASDSILEIGAI